MGHPMVMTLKHDMDRVQVFSYRYRCDWPDCSNLVRWEVTPRRYMPAADLPGNYFCTAHARAIIKRIERAQPPAP